ncbi:type II toxin-antitoxin system death-on-curing family toxin [Crateriforma conspicua]|uniref:Toxin Doc n=1 Tax=Crateriforma conspicua TaxID=2527996 RepID=A0A5C6FPF9_9PLAN|nr:type II toxin-antitoxin system death-on-curing family toxin [Crateriforma conspicua]TWU62283.1 Toxin Doc [Crateriforma conspicua]
MPDIDFLNFDDLVYLHHGQLELYGGDPGLRDSTLLESAIAQPQTTFDGKYLHPFPSGMAAAYVFHIVRNHPFLDGNKRAGIVAALVFLDWNRYDVDAPQGEVHAITFAVANGDKEKADVQAWFEKYARPRQ